MGKKRIAYTIFVEKLDGKRPLDRYRCKWKNDIKTYLKEIVIEDVDWIHLVQDR
jgi:hypothetical protein